MRGVMLGIGVVILSIGVVAGETIDEQVVRLIDEGKYADAEPLAKRAVDEATRDHGPEHPDTAKSLNNLARLYTDQDKFEKAEQSFRQAIAIQEKSLGRDHPHTAMSITNLAVLYFKHGKHDEAAQGFRRALLIFEESLGPNHPYALTVREHLAAFPVE